MVDSNKVKSISIFGITGSVGKSTQEVICNNLDSFLVDTIVAKKNVKDLIKAAILLKPKKVVIYDNNKFGELKLALGSYDMEISSGEECVLEAAKRKVDIFVAAIVGYEGLYTTYNSIPYAKTIALANKESMVCAGNLIMEKSKLYDCNIIPIDSEHNALFQLLDNSEYNYIKKIIITASGGPFLGMKKNQLKKITPDQATKHPIWNMGAKISVDSATMMNKGLELIEAAYLFNLTSSKIDVLVHPQSIIHAIVEYVDGVLKAGLYSPDMVIPISHALHYPERSKNSVDLLDLSLINSLTFQKLDESIFGAVKICREALNSGPTHLIVLNAANEIAVDAFLKNKINFNSITTLVEEVLSNDFEEFKNNISNIIEIDKKARSVSLEIISKGHIK